MEEITTNDRFDRLTNLDISTHYSDIELCVCLSSLSAAFAYWVIAQNPNKRLIDIRPSLREFNEYVAESFENPKLPQKFTYQELQELIDADELAKLPEVLALNELKPDFIDLHALARNVFYMILREHITQY